MIGLIEEEKNDSKKKKKVKINSDYETALITYTKDFKDELSSIYNEIQNFESKNSFFFLEKPYEKLSLNEKPLDNKFINSKESNEFEKDNNKKKKGFGFDFQILNSKNLHYEKISLD